MGKQIRFHMIQEDADLFIEEVKRNNGIIINEDGYELNDEELSKITDNNYIHKRFTFPSFYIKLKDSRVLYNFSERIERKYIDYFKSEVIQFDLCQPVLHHPGMFSEGRLWYQQKYYKDGKEITKANEIDVLFTKLRRYIIKRYQLTSDKFSYIAPNCYNKYKAGNFIPCSGGNPNVIIK